MNAETPTPRPCVYLAGPDVFRPHAIAEGARKKALCHEHGLHAVFPLDADLPDLGTTEADALRIARANEAAMDQSQIILANLTPFRGAGADPGTAYEVGYMRAQGKCVVLYSDDPRPYAERVQQQYGPALQKDENGEMRDPEGMLIEQFGLLKENLMLTSAGEFCSSFEEALQTAAAWARKNAASPADVPPETSEK